MTWVCFGEFSRRAWVIGFWRGSGSWLDMGLPDTAKGETKANQEKRDPGILARFYFILFNNFILFIQRTLRFGRGSGFWSEKLYIIYTL